MSTDSETQVRSRSFRFGPRETNGVILGLGMGSLVAVFGAVFVLTRLLIHGGLGVAFGLALVAVTVAVVWVPVADRPIAGWLPIAAAHLTRRFLGWSSFRGGPAVTGRTGRATAGRATADDAETLGLPGDLSDLAIVGVDTPGGPVGVIKDRRRGLFTIVLATEGSAFQLLTPDEQDARLASWGETLAGLANSTAGIIRIHLTDTTVPDCGDALARRWLADGGRGTDGTAASYGELLDVARPVTQKHELHVALVLDPRKVRRQIRTLAGWRGSGKSGGRGRDGGAGEYLLQRAIAFADELTLAGVNVTGALPPRGVAKLLRTSYEPGSRWALEARGPESDGGGAAPEEAGPAAADSSAWSHYRTDDTFHAVYWIAEWPRHDVPGVFLQDLILRTACERTLSVCLEPRDPRRAADEVARKQTAKGADENIRSRMGFGSSARHRREAAELTAQDEELANGEALYRFLGLIRVSAPDLESLDRACGDIEIAAKNLKLRRLYGEQDAAFNATLPLGRGLRWGWLR